MSINAPQIAQAVEPWFARNARDLPWRQNRDPYRVWLAEIMLQQTQAVTVIDYYHRFLSKFPTLKDLAQASEDDVLALWSGLGYYSRGRNLHKAARYLLSEYDGIFPNDWKSLQNLPGVGSYTAGAICAFAFNKAAPVVDGNVSRVLSRLFTDPTPTNDPKQKTHFEALSQAIVDQSQSPRLCQEGLMELGATLCRPKNPNCDFCPLNQLCAARKQSVQESFPIKLRPRRKTDLHIVCVVPHNETHIWLQKNTKSQLFGGLYTPLNRQVDDPKKALSVAKKLAFGAKIELLKTTDPIVIHRTLTHKQLFLYGFSASIKESPKIGLKVSKSELNSVGISTALRILLAQL